MGRKKDDEGKVTDIEQARRKKAEQEPPPGETWRDKLEAKKHSINERFGLMDERGRLYIWSTKPDSNGRWSIYSEKDFRLKMANETVDVPSASGDVKPMNPVGAWLAWPQRREFTGSGMWPVGEEPAGMLNMWLGFGVEPKPGKWDTIQEFIFNVICAGKQAEYDYLLDLLAWKIQHPFAAPEVALALRGDTGVGKGTLARIVRRLFGSTFKAVASSDSVLGTFNDVLLGSTVLFLDEAFFAGDPRQVDKFKAFVTEPTLMIRPMYRSVFEQSNTIFWIIATNHERVVDAMGKDRRHFVLEPSDARQGDLDYWKRVHAAIDGEELQAFLDELLSFDLSDWHPRQDVPQTEALQTQKEMSLKGVAAFVAELLENGSLERARVRNVTFGDTMIDGWQDGEQTLEMASAYDAYCAWHVERRQSGPVPPTKSFQSQMAKWLPLSTRERDKESSLPRRYWQLPPHPECEQHFRDCLSGKRARPKA